MIQICILCLYRAREALRQCLPDQLRDGTFSACLQEDKSTKHWLTQLIKNLETHPSVDQSVGMSPLTPQETIRVNIN